MKVIIVSHNAKSVDPFNLNINPVVTYQTISGFGGANSIWCANYLSSTEVDLAFNVGNSGLGLSFF